MEQTQNHLEVVNNVTEEDAFRFAWYHIFHEPSQKWRAWACYAVLVASPPYFLISSRVLPGLAALVGLGIAVATPVLYRREILSQVRQRMHTRPGDYGEATVQISPQGVRETCELGAAELRWVAFQRIVSTPDAIYMYRYPDGAWIIPRRAFASSEAANVFVAAAQEWHSAATGSASRNSSSSGRTSS